MRHLLAAGASPDQPDATGSTPLMKLASSRYFSPEIGNILLAAGANPLATDEDDDSALALAAHTGQYRALEWLLDECNVPIDITPSKGPYTGYTALHIACRRGYADCTQLLLARDAPIEARNGEAATPLMLAATNCTDLPPPQEVCANTLCLRLLLEAGADPLTCDDDGWNALHLASKAGCLAAVDTLLDAGHAYEQATQMTAMHCPWNPNMNPLDIVFDSRDYIEHHASPATVNTIINRLLTAMDDDEV